MAKLNRRDFLKHSGLFGTAVSLQGLGLNLAHANQALANLPVDDYKALVAIFLLGGNDHANTLIPLDDFNYNLYQKYRSTVALSRDEILPLTPSNTLDGDIRYGLHPTLKNIHNLFHHHEIAIIQNMGALVRPTTKEQYFNQPNHLPPKLFSHNDQQSFWQTGDIQNYRAGWGALTVKPFLAANQHPMFSTINTELGSSLPLVQGAGVQAYTLNQDGATIMTGIGNQQVLYGNPAINSMVDGMMRATRDNILEQYFADTFAQSIATQKLLKDIYTTKQFDSFFASQNTQLATNLKSVVKMIHANQQLGMKRQVFIVVHPAYDHHDNLLTQHQRLLHELDDGLGSFNAALQAIGMNQQVTTFTLSEFGRTFSINGDGSDHGWGGHQFVMGGAVKGAMIYGKTPQYGIDTPDDVGSGRLIPTTATDQFIATLAAWFGVTDDVISQIAIHINNFEQKNLMFI